LTELIYPEDRALFFKSFTDRISGKDVEQRGIYRINHKDGGVRCVELFSALINYNNKPATQTVFIDITEREKAEKEIIKKNKELTAFNKLAVGRELKMIELKREINELMKKMGEKEKYKIF